MEGKEHKNIQILIIKSGHYWSCIMGSVRETIVTTPWFTQDWGCSSKESCILTLFGFNQSFIIFYAPQPQPIPLSPDNWKPPLLAS